MQCTVKYLTLSLYSFLSSYYCNPFHIRTYNTNNIVRNTNNYIHKSKQAIPSALNGNKRAS